MTQKCGGAKQSEAQIHALVLKALKYEESKEKKRLGRVHEDSCRPTKSVLPVTADAPEMEQIVMLNTVSGTNSLSRTEWMSMEAAMVQEEMTTHNNLARWMKECAKSKGVKDAEEDDDNDEEYNKIADELAAEEGDSEDEESAAAKPEAAPKRAPQQQKPTEADEDDSEQKEEKRWGAAAVNLTCDQCKLSFRGNFTKLAFCNWLWYRVIRPKLEETKGKSFHHLAEVDVSANAFGIEDVEDVLGSYMSTPIKTGDEKEEKSEKSKKGKKETSKKDPKDSKKTDKKKKKKDAITLSKQEGMMADNFIKNMIYGESGKKKRQSPQVGQT